MKRIFIGALFTLLVHLSANSQGIMITDTVEAVSLKNNLIGESTRQCIAVYLPLSYRLFGEKHYPVIYFLPEYGETPACYLKGYFKGFFLEKLMNELTLSSKIAEMIVVVVNGYNRLEGSFFHNSPVTGNWDDFVVKDVVKHMDSLYRTLPQKESRAIIGLSMGGYGAFELAMSHPDVFSVCVAQSAFFVRPGDMTKTPMFRDPLQIRRTYHLIDYLGQFSVEEAHRRYLDTIASIGRKGDWMMMMGLAYASAFAPNASIRAPYIDYPYFITEDDALILNPDILKRYEEGIGSLESKIKKHSHQLKRLHGIGIVYGKSDLFRWIPAGNERLDSLLTARRIKHKTWVNDGGHGEQLRQQMEEAVLPFISERLDFNMGNAIHRRAKSEAQTQSER